MGGFSPKFSLLTKEIALEKLIWRNEFKNISAKIIQKTTDIHHFHHHKLKFLKNKSLYSMRTKVKSLPKLIINIAEDPVKLCKDDIYGIAITGEAFERIYILNERFIKKKFHS